MKVRTLERQILVEEALSEVFQFFSASDEPTDAHAAIAAI